MIRDNITQELIQLHDRRFKHFTISNDAYVAEVTRLRFKYIIDYDRDE